MKRPLILNTNGDFAPTKPEQFLLIKEAGFDGVFTFGEDEKIGEFAEKLKELNMIYQSVHAPFMGVNALWEENNEKAEAISEKLMFSLKQCIKYEIPLLVIHAYIGFNKHSPNDLGVERFGKIVKYAENSGVKIAFENTEGMEYLECLMKAFKNESHVGFCFDSGHEMCYNYSIDMLAKYGGKLFGTHLNDNLGIKSLDNKIIWTDDLHLLPFDGIADWNSIAKRIANTGFSGALTFELNVSSKPDRHDNDKYKSVPINQYLAESYARACKIRNIIESL